MRSLLFAPGDDARKIEKALGSDADAVILDIEDSVALDNKPKARELILAALMERSDNSSAMTVFVRVNALPTGLIEDDLSAIVQARPDGIMFPKSNGAHDLATLEALLGPLESAAGITSPIGVIALASETAHSLFTMGSYVEPGPRLTAIAWGGEDLSVDLGATTNRLETGDYTDPYRLARTLCLAAARAAGVVPVDSVYVNFKDDAGLRAECLAGMRDGFSAKLAIHPAQVPIINDVFTPSLEEITRARDIVAAFSDAGNPGVIGLGGEMLDIPHLKRAQDLIARAKAYSKAY